MMRRLYDIIVLFKEYFLFGLFLVLSTILLASNDTQQIRGFRTVAIGSVGFLQDLFNFIPGYFNLKAENRALREVNLNLADEVNRLREQRLETIRLRRLLEMKEHPAFGYLAADVVGKNLQLLRNTITINIGSNDGVRVNMPVVDDKGLVGKVAETSGGYAVAQILLNKDLRISAKDERSRVDGIIRWEGGSTLTMEDVSKTLDVQAGDVIITSEYSSLFPPNIRIGVVRSARQVSGELFQQIDVDPGVDFTHLEEVFVVQYSPDSGRTALHRPARGDRP